MHGISLSTNKAGILMYRDAWRGNWKRFEVLTYIKYTFCVFMHGISLSTNKAGILMYRDAWRGNWKRFEVINLSERLW